MFAFIAGLFLAFIGFSLLNGLRGSNPVAGYLGVVILILGAVLFIGALVVQAKKSREER